MYVMCIIIIIVFFFLMFDFKDENILINIGYEMILGAEEQRDNNREIFLGLFWNQKKI